MSPLAQEVMPVTRLSRREVVIASLLAIVLLPSVLLFLKTVGASPFQFFSVPVLLASWAVSLWMAGHWKEWRALPLSLVVGTLVAWQGMQLAFRGGYLSRSAPLTLAAEMLLWAAVPLGFVSIAYLWRIFENQARFTHARKALEQSEARYRHLIENATDAFYVADADGRFTLVNPGGARIFGRRGSDLVGMSLFSLISDEVANDIKTSLDRQLHGKSAAFYHEFPVTGREGKITWVGENVQAVIDRGHLAGFQAVMRDISEQRKAKEDVRLVEFALDNTEEHVFMLNRSAKIIYANKRAMNALGYTAAEIRVKTIHDIDPQLSTEDWQSTWQAAKSGEGPVSESIHVAKDGQTFPVMTSSSYFEFQGIGYIFAFVKDISREAELSAQLRQSQKVEAIGTLAGGIAHDFNNILSAIIGYTELSLGEAPKEGNLPVFLTEVKKAADRAADMVKQILTFSRSKEKKHQPLLLGPVIKEATKLLRGSLPATIEVRQHIAANTSPVMSDPVQVHQVVMNLCTNAYHAMREHGGILKIELHDLEVDADEAVHYLNVTPGTYVRLSVSDTGCGMNEETRRQIFEPFFTTKEEGEGTGLGMATVLSIVKSHGGSIRVESEPGEGSRMTILFPVCVDTTSTTRGTGEPVARNGTETVLLVDDETPIATSVSLGLGRLGYVCRVCRDGQEALAILRTAPDDIDILVTDYTMPGMTGLELCRAAHTTRPELPVILCTGRSHEIELNADEHYTILPKPFTVAALTERIRAALDGNA